MPAIGLGTWQVFDVAGDRAGLADARETLKAFADLGGRVVDSSPMYGSAESVTGQLAAELELARPALGRDQGVDDRPPGRRSARWRSRCAGSASSAST